MRVLSQTFFALIFDRKLFLLFVALVFLRAARRLLNAVDRSLHHEVADLLTRFDVVRFGFQNAFPTEDRVFIIFAFAQLNGGGAVDFNVFRRAFHRVL